MRKQMFQDGATGEVTYLKYVIIIQSKKTAAACLLSPYMYAVRRKIPGQMLDEDFV